MVKIGLPAIDGHAESGIGLVAPQLLPREGDAIDPLGVFSALMGVAVGQDVTSLDTFDDAALGTGIAWQPGMAGRMQIPGSDGIADREERGLRHGPIAGTTLGENCRNVLRRGGT